MANIAANCLGIVLSLYDYQTIDQYNSFINLLELSNADIPAQYVSKICTEYMEYETHDWLIKITQGKFYARQKGERWDQKIPQWLIKDPVKVIKNAKEVGVLSEVELKHSHFECAAIFGSTAPNMKLRIKFFKNEIENKMVTIDKVFLLTGERYALFEVDGGKDYVHKVAEEYKVDESKVTETMLMENIYKQELLDTTILKKIPFKIVNTQRGKKSRPNTIDTIEKFLKDLSPTECQTIVYVSKAPYTLSQAEDAKKIMYMKSPKRKFDVIGGSVGEEIKQVNLESAAYHTTMAMAGQFYGGFEMATMKINSKYNMCSSIPYLTNYKKIHFSKKHKIASTNKVELPNTKIN